MLLPSSVHLSTTACEAAPFLLVLLTGGLFSTFRNPFQIVFCLCVVFHLTLIAPEVLYQLWKKSFFHKVQMASVWTYKCSGGILFTFSCGHQKALQTRRVCTCAVWRAGRLYKVSLVTVGGRSREPALSCFQHLDSGHMSAGRTVEVSCDTMNWVGSLECACRFQIQAE